MIKITNAQIMAFNNQITKDMLSSDDRRFPTADAFRLADFITQIEPKIRLCQEQTRMIIKSHGGVIESDGHVSGLTSASKQSLDQELSELNAVEVEFTGERLKPSDGWPDLNIYEAMVLKPLLDTTLEKREGTHGTERDHRGS